MLKKSACMWAISPNAIEDSSLHPLSPFPKYICTSSQRVNRSTSHCNQLGAILINDVTGQRSWHPGQSPNLFKPLK